MRMTPPTPRVGRRFFSMRWGDQPEKAGLLEPSIGSGDGCPGLTPRSPLNASCCFVAMSMEFRGGRPAKPGMIGHMSPQILHVTRTGSSMLPT